MVSYDDVDMAAWEPFSLTTVRQDVDELARRVSRLLLDRPQTPPRQVRIEPALVVRGSTGHAPAPTPSSTTSLPSSASPPRPSAAADSPNETTS